MSFICFHFLFVLFVSLLNASATPKAIAKGVILMTTTMMIETHHRDTMPYSYMTSSKASLVCPGTAGFPLRTQLKGTYSNWLRETNGCSNHHVASLRGGPSRNL